MKNDKNARIFVSIMGDSFQTISSVSKIIYTEKRSKFIAFAIPFRTENMIKEEIQPYRKEFYDARHICWAYMLGANHETFRSNDDGEPSGTAGKPILGQINSFELTNILVLVVRYFGGIKLGTSGLINAYKTSAKMVLESADIITEMVKDQLHFSFEYPLMSAVMKIIKDIDAKIVLQQYTTNYEFKIQINQSQVEDAYQRLSKIETLFFIDKTLGTDSTRNF